jgi:hypothetical protein
MKSTSRTIIKTTLFVTFLVGLAIIIWPHAAVAFDIKQGIVGNLSEDCRLTGDCDWCDFIDLMGILQRVILSIFGGVALIMLIWAGQSMITAGGNQEKVSASKKLITSTLFGVLIILVGYFLINVVINVLINQTGTTSAKLYGNNWFTAGCVETNPKGERFCRSQPVGTKCDGGTIGDWVCDNSESCQPTCGSLKLADPTSTFVCKDKCETPFQDAGRGYCSTKQVCCYSTP